MSWRTRPKGALMISWRRRRRFTTATGCSHAGILSGAVDAFGADKVYFVHNHPGDTLRPSPQDRQIHRQLQGMIGIGMTGESVIIDVTSGRYCTFDDAESEAHTRDDG